MRDYLYIPLGGNRVSAKRLYFNLWFVFLLSGFWHGASWNFIIWGAYHGIFLVVERAFLSGLLKRAGKLISVVYAFVVVVIGWVFFRIEQLSDALLYVRQMFSFNIGDTVTGDIRFWTVMGIALFFSFITLNASAQRLCEGVFINTKWKTSRHVVMFFAGLILYVICVAYVGSMGFNPFIYFRF